MFLIYDTATGVGRMSINSETLATANLQSGEAYIAIPETVGNADDLTVVDGAVVTQAPADVDPLIFAREIRSACLSASDWTQVADVALTDSKKAEWATYRQQLRDFPATITAELTTQRYAQAASKRDYIEGLLPNPPGD